MTEPRGRSGEAFIVGAGGWGWERLALSWQTFSQMSIAVACSRMGLGQLR